MESPTARELVHKVNNLLAVIFTQSAVGRASTDPKQAQEALHLIDKSAHETAEIVKRFTADLRRNEAEGSQ